MVFMVVGSCPNGGRVHPTDGRIGSDPIRPVHEQGSQATVSPRSHRWCRWDGMLDPLPSTDQDQDAWRYSLAEGCSASWLIAHLIVLRSTCSVGGGLTPNQRPDRCPPACSRRWVLLLSDGTVVYLGPAAPGRRVPLLGCGLPRRLGARALPTGAVAPGAPLPGRGVKGPLGRGGALVNGTPVGAVVTG